jgi:hypothetical protein
MLKKLRRDPNNKKDVLVSLLSEGILIGAALFLFVYIIIFYSPDQLPPLIIATPVVVILGNSFYFHKNLQNYKRICLEEEQYNH